MHFSLTEDQIAVQHAARDFAQQELLPGVIARDAAMKFPEEEVRKMAEMGFLGMMVSPEYGGGGMDTISDYRSGSFIPNLTFASIGQKLQI